MAEANGQRPCAKLLLIADLKGDRDAIFQGITEVALPYLDNEVSLIYFASVDDDWVQGTEKGEPFYKRRRGLFG